MDLSIITVTLNAEDFIEKQIRSVQKATEGVEFEHIIVDNGSNDGTVGIIENNFSHIKIIKNKINTGFSHANNQAASLAGGKIFLCLNPDMELKPKSLKKIIDWMNLNTKVGISSCLLLNKLGKINLEATPRRFPTVFNQLAIVFKIHHFFPKILSSYLYSGFDWRVKHEVDSVRGSFMLIKRSIYDKLGWLFDPRYYIWFDDVDLCQHVRKMGYVVVHNPLITAVDLVGQTFKKQNKLWKQRCFTDSMIKYFKKWYPWYVWMWVWVSRPVGLILVCFFNKTDKKDYL